MAINWTALGKFAGSPGGAAAITGGLGVIGGIAQGKAQDRLNEQNYELATQNSDRDYEIALLNDQRQRQQAALEGSQLNPLAQWQSRAKAQLISDLLAKGGYTHQFDYDSGMGSYSNPLASLSPDTLQMLSRQSREQAEAQDFTPALNALSGATQIGPDGKPIPQWAATANATPRNNATTLAQQLAAGKGGPVAPNSDGQGNPIPVTFNQGADGLLYHANGVPVQGQDWKNTPVPKGFKRGEYGQIQKKGTNWWKLAAGVGLAAATGGIASPAIAAAIGAGGGAAIGAADGGGWKGALLGGATGGAGGFAAAGSLLGKTGAQVATRIGGEAGVNTGLDLLSQRLAAEGHAIRNRQSAL